MSGYNMVAVAPPSIAGTSSNLTSFDSPTGVSVSLPMPSRANQWSVPLPFYRTSLDKPFPPGAPNTYYSRPQFNATLNVVRRAPKVTPFSDLNGILVQGSPAITFTGYSTWSDLNPRDEFVRTFTQVPPTRNTTLSVPMVNCMMIDKAVKHQMNPSYSYDLASITRQFSLDGVICTVVGDEITTDRHYGIPEADITVTKEGKMVMKNLWGPGLTSATVLYMGFKKFKARDLINLPYNVNPSSSKNSAYADLLEQLSTGYCAKNGKTYQEQYVWQLVPLQPILPRFPTLDEQASMESLYYTDEYGMEHMTKKLRLAHVEMSMGSRYSASPFNDDGVGISDACVNTAALTSCNTIDVFVGTSVI